MEIRMGASKFSVIFGICLVFLSGTVLASGLTFDGLGVKARGMGGAFRAVADDWSATYYNPAGLNLIDANNQISFNVDVTHNRYLTTPDVLWGGVYESGYLNDQEIANKHEILNIPQGAIVTRLPIWGEMVFGLSVLQTFDQNQTWTLYDNLNAHNDSLTFPDDQYKVNFDAVNFELSLAKGFMEDRLSLGLGLALVRADLVYNDVVLRDNPMPAPISDRPHEKIPEWYSVDGNGWGFGYRFGALYQVTDNIKAAMTYVGKTSIDISGEGQLSLYMGKSPYITEYITAQDLEAVLFLGGDEISYTNDFKTTIDLPASLGGGVAVDLLDKKLTVALDAEMIFWSKFKGFDFAFSNYNGTSFENETILTNSTYGNAQDLIETDMSAPIAWKDAPRVMLGVEWKPYSFTSVRGGFGVDKSAIDFENSGGITQVPQFIDLGTKHKYSFGIGFEVNQWTLEFATSYTHQPDIVAHTTVDQDGDGLMDNITGIYKADNYQTLVGISYRF